MRITIDQQADRRGLNTIITTTQRGNTSRHHNFFETLDKAIEYSTKSYRRDEYDMSFQHNDSIVLIDILK